MLTIEEIRRMGFVGNHFSDSDRFTKITRFILHQDTDMASKVEALQIMQSRGMGLDEVVTEKDVHLFISDPR